MVSPGMDCNIALSHPTIDDGTPFGFLLDDSKEAGPAVSIQREAVQQDDGSYLDNQKYFFTVLLADKLPNPDGSTHQENAADMYTALMLYLSQHNNLGLLTPTGTFSGLYASGHYATEVHFPDMVLVTVQMSSSGTAFAPVDVTHFVLSEWVDDTVYAGEMTWSNTYWR